MNVLIFRKKVSRVIFFLFEFSWITIWTFFSFFFNKDDLIRLWLFFTIFKTAKLSEAGRIFVCLFGEGECRGNIKIISHFSSTLPRDQTIERNRVISHSATRKDQGCSSLSLSLCVKILSDLIIYKSNYTTESPQR